MTPHPKATALALTICAALAGLALPIAPVAVPVAAEATSAALPGSGGYPRAIVLAQADPSGNTILETDTDGFMSGRQRLFRSSDGGSTFDQLPSLEVTGVIHGTSLLELPAPAGDLPAGAVLLALAVNPSRQYPPDGKDTRMNIPVFASTDHGETWNLRSYCMRTDLPGTTGGLWEPDLHIADDGRLVCLYSDETQRPDHSQVLTQVVSADGGATWSAPDMVVASPNPIDRPGMPTVARLSDGTWAMTYEDCGLRHSFCQVLIRFGPDGLTWGDPETDGTVITSTTGSRFSSAPTVAWSPAGGADGTLLVVARILNKANGFADPGNGLVILANDQRGRGPWTPIDAPVPLRDPNGNDTPVNYSSPLVPLGADRLLGFAAQRLEPDDTLEVRYGTVRIPSPLPEPPATSTTTTTTTTAPGTPPPPAAPATPVPADASYTG